MLPAGRFGYIKQHTSDINTKAHTAWCTHILNGRGTGESSVVRALELVEKTVAKVVVGKTWGGKMHKTHGKNNEERKKKKRLVAADLLHDYVTWC